MRLLAALALALLAALGGRASAETLVAAVSQNRVAISANFDGSELLIFGAVRREAPVPEGAPMQVIVTLEGPSTPMTVWRKERVAGIWVNASAQRILRAPLFYAVATSAPLAEALLPAEDVRHQISVERAIRAAAATADTDGPAFVQALLRLRGRADHYQLLEGAVRTADETLFHTRITLPADLTEGRFILRIFLTRDGRVIDRTESRIDVEKVGLERFLFRLSRDEPLAYGLLSLLIAIAAGWAASEAFRRLRG